MKKIIIGFTLVSLSVGAVVSFKSVTSVKRSDNSAEQAFIISREKVQADFEALGDQIQAHPTPNSANLSAKDAEKRIELQVKIQSDLDETNAQFVKMTAK